MSIYMAATWRMFLKLCPAQDFVAHHDLSCNFHTLYDKTLVECRGWNHTSTPGKTSEIHPFFSTVVVGWSSCLSSSSTPGMGIDTLNIKTYIDHIFAIWFLYVFIMFYPGCLFKMTVTCLFRFSSFGVKDSRRGFGVPQGRPNATNRTSSY